MYTDRARVWDSVANQTNKACGNYQMLREALPIMTEVRVESSIGSIDNMSEDLIPKGLFRKMTKFYWI